MNNDMRENLKVGLLGVIALTLVVNTYFAASKKSGAISSAVPAANSAAIASPATENALTPNPNPSPNPTIATTIGQENNAITPPSNQKSTRISFGTYNHDFGKIKQNSTNKFSFKFTNTGDEPLIISNAVGSCGCTVPNYPKEPIAPGANAAIDVEYKPGLQKGQQEKKVTVTANTQPSETVLSIKAEVLEE